MKKVTLIALAMVMALVLSSTAFAAIEVEGDAYAGIYSQYLWRGIDLSGGSAVAQGGMDLSAKGFTLSYWSNIQLKDDVVLGSDVNKGNATETDMTLDYTFSPLDKLSVSLGTIWYALDGADDTKEAYLGLSYDVILQPAVKVYYDYDEATENGLFFTASIGHTFQVMDKLGVNLGALVSYNDESDYAVGDYKDWHNYELSVSADYAITDQLSISPSILYSHSLSNDAKDVTDDGIVTGAVLTFTF
jgi:uncharacterized protein (TIGR02001 family)